MAPAEPADGLSEPADTTQMSGEDDAVPAGEDAFDLLGQLDPLAEG